MAKKVGMRRASAITKAEGKKVSIGIGQVREVLGRETDLIVAEVIEQVVAKGSATLDDSASYCEFIAECNSKLKAAIHKLRKK